MGFDITDKVALITGGSSGIGYNIAKQLLKQRLKGVALLDVDDLKGQMVANEFIGEFGPDSCIFVKTDVSQQSQMEDAFELTVQTFNQLDIVINNAGVISEIDWKKCLNINLGGCMVGTVLAIDTYLPKFKSGPEGVIINVASISGIDPLYSLPMYSSTKHGIVGLCRAYGVKNHYEETKVRVIAVCPGITATSILTGGDLKPEYRERFKATKRPYVQTPEFVAESVIDIVKEGQNGSVWTIEDSEPANEVDFRDWYTKRK